MEKNDPTLNNTRSCYSSVLIANFEHRFTYMFVNYEIHELNFYLL